MRDKQKAEAPSGKTAFDISQLKELLLSFKKLLIKQGARLERFRLSQAAFLLLCGTLLGAVSFLIIYGTEPLNVSNDIWIINGHLEPDITQAYAGWLLFRNSPWQWPLGVARDLLYPTGHSIAFTDSIPLAAIIFKLFSPILPKDFQYFGIYSLLCFILQGIAACKLLNLFRKNRLFIAMGAVLFLFSPIMIERSFRHPSLSSHWLILFAIYLYFKSKKSGYKRTYLWQYMVLNFAAFAISPYFVPITFGIMAAAVCDDFRYNRKWKRAAIYLALNTLAVVLSGLTTGILLVEGESGTVFYGTYSMNLNALFNPTSCGNIVWASTPTSSGNLIWSKLLMVHEQIYGNYDSFNYLGLGVLAAMVFLVISFVACPKKGKAAPIKSFLNRHVFLAVICIIYTLFAITNVVTFNGKEIGAVKLPEAFIKLCGTFQASGRMFYPVFYLIFLTVIVKLAAIKIKHGTKPALALLALVLLIQIWDMQPALKFKHDYFTGDNVKQKNINVVSSSFWEDCKDKYDMVINLELERSGGYSYILAVYAGKNHLKLNENLFARNNYEARKKLLDAELADIKSGNIDPKKLYVFIHDKDSFNELRTYIDEDKAICAYVDAYMVIAPRYEGMRYDYTEFTLAADRDAQEG
ncbi:MAG: DUF6311 domain-containing protein [Oscillospiraceae bacterium]|jgi:hypothetical protein|nr:DUF6311 domain-containing protein [Oscillospiraceae bacterium]